MTSQTWSAWIWSREAESACSWHWQSWKENWFFCARNNKCQFQNRINAVGTWTNVSQSDIASGLKAVRIQTAASLRAFTKAENCFPSICPSTKRMFNIVRVNHCGSMGVAQARTLKKTLSMTWTTWICSWLACTASRGLWCTDYIFETAYTHGSC